MVVRKENLHRKMAPVAAAPSLALAQLSTPFLLWQPSADPTLKAML